MKETYTLHYNQGLNFNVDKPTDICVEEVGECPLCHVATSPRFINGYLIGSKENNIPLTAFVILYCPRCKQLYVAKYMATNGGKAGLTLVELYPYTKQQVLFNENIASLSEEFISIYNQALAAETNDLTKGLAGLGYRKSLEYLIKDYLIKLKHQDKNTIINLELAKCVDKLDDDLKDIAKASTWIGNDETHYFRKNPDYDIEDLKDFINCLVADIEREYVRQKAKKLVNKE